MTDTHYKIAEAIQKVNVTATERECIDLLTFSGCETEKELLLKLIKVTAQYVIDLKEKEYIVAYSEMEKRKYSKLNRDIASEYEQGYKENMKQRKEAGIYPADKKISYEVVKRLKDEGLTQEQVADKLGISRSTVCRKLKEAKEKGFENKPLIKMGWK